MSRDQAEKLRQIIKSNEAEIINECQADIITVTSGKGGVGKSNVSVNLALELIKKDKKVLIIDADLGLANVEILMGQIPKYSLLEVINGSREITEIISEGPNGLKFISGGSGIGELANASEEKLRNFALSLGKLDTMFDTIIIDTGAGISETVMAFTRVAKQILLVTTSDPTSVTDAYALLKVLTNDMAEDTPNIKVIVNMVKNMTESEAVFNKLNMVCEKFLNRSLDVIEYLPSDEALEKAVRMQKPVTIQFPKSSISLAIERLAYKVNRICDDEVEIENVKVESKKMGLLGLINNFIKK